MEITSASSRVVQVLEASGRCHKLVHCSQLQTQTLKILYELMWSHAHPCADHFTSSRHRKGTPRQVSLKVRRGGAASVHVFAPIVICCQLLKVYGPHSGNLSELKSLCWKLLGSAFQASALSSFVVDQAGDGGISSGILDSRLFCVMKLEGPDALPSLII